MVRPHRSTLLDRGCHGDYNRGLTGSLGSLNSEQGIWTGSGLLSGSTPFRITNPHRTTRMTKFCRRQIPNTRPMAAALGSGHSAFILCMLSGKSICPLIPNIHKPIYKALRAIHILNISVIG